MQPIDRPVNPDATVDYQPIDSLPADTVNISQQLSTEETGIHAPPHSNAYTQNFDIPGYRVIRELAKGGMGRVYAAIDLTLDREVAIKTLLAGADAARFVTEAKITAQLPHPAIPPVYSIGNLADGTPWLSMKLIRGRTLAELLRDRIPTKEEMTQYVQIFEQITLAVGFAHSRGILHRDLKPMNVMVGEFGEVQVMDWGLAKARSGDDVYSITNIVDGNNELPQNTAVGTIMGTPGYMAPEQARGEVVDERADVFALGSILAAILTGHPAFIGSSSLDTIRKAASGDLTDVFARLDKSSMDAELIAITKCCLESNKELRPSDAREVSTRIASYRANVDERLRRAETEAAEALVREQEQVKRRRTILKAGVMVVGVLLLGIIGTTAGLMIALRQTEIARKETIVKDAALTSEREAKQEVELKKEEAERNLGFARKGNEILGSVFANLDPTKIAESGRPLQDVLRENLKTATVELEGSSIGDPTEVAKMQHILGWSLLGLGEFDLTIQMLEKSFNSYKDQYGPTHAATLVTMNNLALGYKAAGNLEKAFSLLDESLLLHRTSYGPDHPNTLAGLNNLALCYEALGKTESALQMFEESFKLHEAKLGSEAPQTLTSMHNLAMAYARAVMDDKAIILFEKTLQLRRAILGETHPETLVTVHSLASCYSSLGKLELARPLKEEAFRLRSSTLGPDHPDTLISKSALASFYQTAGQLDLALPLYQEALQLMKVKLGPNHSDTLLCMSNLASGYSATGKVNLALPLFEEVLAIRKQKLGVDHPQTLDSMNNLATSYYTSGNLDRALPLFEETLKLMRSKLGEEHRETLLSMSNLAVAYSAIGKYEQAMALYKETYEVRLRVLGTDHLDTVMSMNNLAMAYKQSNQLHLAMPLLQETLKIRKEKLGIDHPHTLTSMHNLAAGFNAAGDFDAGLPILEELLELRKKKLGEDHPSTLNTMNSLATVYQDTQKHDLALPLFKVVYEISKEKLGDDHPNTLLSMNNLAVGYRIAGQRDLALPLIREALRLRQNKLGPDHPDTLSSLNSLAVYYNEGGEHELAIPVFEETLRLRKSKLGEKHLSTLVTMSNLAKAYSSAKKLELSLQIQLECLELSKSVLAPNDPNTLLFMFNTASIYEKLNQYDKAIDLFTATLERTKEKYGPHHAETLLIQKSLGTVYAKSHDGEKAEAYLGEYIASIREVSKDDELKIANALNGVGLILLECQRFSAAEKLLRECLSIRENREPEKWTTFHVMSMLGETLTGQQKYNEAEPYLLQGFEGLKSLQQAITPDVREIHLCRALDRLINLYTLLEKPDDTQKYRDLRSEYCQPTITE